MHRQHMQQPAIEIRRVRRAERRPASLGGAKIPRRQEWKRGDPEDRRPAQGQETHGAA
jgi:hypothetical protein